jgi:hypothetical protein
MLRHILVGMDTLSQAYHDQRIQPCNHVLAGQNKSPVRNHVPGDRLIRKGSLVLELPVERRRPLSSRLPDILADRRSGPCKKSCKICFSIRPGTASAALACWDNFAASDTWPVPVGQILAFLRTQGFLGDDDLQAKKVRQLLHHRRMQVLHFLVQSEVKKHGVEA